jgi:hypothetical protein
MIVIDSDLIRPCDLSDSHHDFGERRHHETLDICFLVCNRLDELNISRSGLLTQEFASVIMKSKYPLMFFIFESA